MMRDGALLPIRLSRNLTSSQLFQTIDVTSRSKTALDHIPRNVEECGRRSSKVCRHNHWQKALTFAFKDNNG